MVFCNPHYMGLNHEPQYSHNPYFNRWFSAIFYGTTFKNVRLSHNPYFNRWFSAIGDKYVYK